MVKQGWDRHYIRVGCHLIIEKNGKILMNKRRNTGYWDGYYALMGGHIDSGESITQTAVREAYEELGIRILEKDLKIVNVVNKHEGKEESLVFALKVKKWKGVPENKEPTQSYGIEWFSMNKLPRKTIPYVKHVIKNIQNNVFYSEYGWN